MKVKRLFSLTAAILLIFTMLPQAVFADSGDPAMSDGGAALERNVNSQNAQILHYGGKTWYVIGYNGNGAASVSSSVTLLAKENAGHTQYAPNTLSNAYGTSWLKTKIKEVAGTFSAVEQGAVVKRTLEGGSGNFGTETYNNDKISGDTVENDLLWPLSVKEANAVKEELRKSDPANPAWLSSFWWLRSPGLDDGKTAIVNGYGTVLDLGDIVNGNELGVRPAFYLNLESVLFTSAAEGGKSCTEGALTQIGTNSSNEWKVTLKDKAHADFAVNTCAVTYDSSTGALTVPYSGVKTAGDNEYISAIVKNSQGEITYYGRIAKASTADDASVTINTSGKVGDGDKLYVFSEQFNGDKTGETGAKTDYASDLQEVPLANGSHDWEFKGFEWTGDETNGYTKAVANYVCENDSTHTDTVDATVTEAVTEPTTTTTGKTTYSATVPSDKSLDGQPHDATNTENAEKEAKVTDMIVYTFTEGDGSTWTKGSSDNLDVTVKRSVDDDTTFARCQKITVDGKTELTDADCTKAEGSLKLSLKQGFLEKLSEGKHTLVVTFDDGDSPEMTFTIKAKAEEETKPDTSPTTGDHNNAGLWAAIMGGSLLAVILLITAGRKYLKKHR